MGVQDLVFNVPCNQVDLQREKVARQAWWQVDNRRFSANTEEYYEYKLIDIQ